MKQNMKFSNAGQALLMDIEGFREKPYKDLAGHPTIGFGHKIKPGEVFDTITKGTAIMMMMEDAKPFENFINYYIPVDSTQNQFDALVIFLFNIGEDKFSKSTVYTNLKLGHFEEATVPWAKWINVTKTIADPITGIEKKVLVPIDGLITRRKREIELFKRR
jgi:lysozyme